MIKQLIATSLLFGLCLPAISWAQVTVSPSPGVSPSTSTLPSVSVTPPPSIEEQIFAPALPFVHFLGQMWAILAAWLNPANFKPLTCQVVHWLENVPYFPKLKYCLNVGPPQIPKLPSIHREQPTFAPGKPIF